MDFTDKERCVDDCLFWDVDLESHWWRNIDYLETTGNAGMVLNVEKFQCCRKAVEFAGFKINSSTVEPLPKYIEAILKFPTPQNLTDVRAWFGLTNQVAHYAQLRDLVAPMRPLMKKNAKFVWTPELEEAFEKSKAKIVEAIKDGVMIFDKNRATCMPTDWSKRGIGYYLMQKHCECTVDPPCCENGWKITLAGSRQLKPAESRYAPVEGEMLAVVWGLNQTRYFTQGCKDLLVLTDHKPLLKLLGDRTLDEIENMRLFRLKEKTSRWQFRVKHNPGKRHYVADATSRNPVGLPDSEDEELSTEIAVFLNDYSDETDDIYTTEIALVTGLKEELNKIKAVTWERIKSAMEVDADMKELRQLILVGLPHAKEEMPAHLIKYWKYVDSMYELDGVIMCKNRILIPDSLKQEVLEGLHAAHQGVVSMLNYAECTVIWPGISRDIQLERERCASCNKNAPSNPRLPSEEPMIPSMPFQCVCSDYFELEGFKFLVTVDRLSGWCEVFRAKSGTESAGARGLISALRRLFATFGVPQEVSSDGGPEFIAKETEDFFDRWGVKHRLSSAYHPSSNGRAELGVKSMKRLLHDNVGPGGDLNNDKFVRALLTHRNTPDPISKKSPSEILFGHKLRDSLPVFSKGPAVFDDERVSPVWREGWSLKEQALRSRAVKTVEALNEHSRDMPVLRHKDRVFIQNQAGNHPGKWDRTGTIVECRPHDQYGVKYDGSGRVSLRNRQFLKKFVPPKKNVFLGTAPSEPAQVHQPETSEVTTENQDIAPPTNNRSTDERNIETPPMAVQNATDPNKLTQTPPPRRKSTRTKKAVTVYDASTGGYVRPESGSP